MARTFMKFGMSYLHYFTLFSRDIMRLYNVSMINRSMTKDITLILF